MLNANTGTGLSYQWKLNGGTIPGATSPSYTTSSAGNYTVVVTTSLGCSTASAAMSVFVNTCPVTLNLRVFISGLYRGNRLMTATVDTSRYPTLSDTVTVELHRSTTPYGIAEAMTGTISTSGYGNFIFSLATLGNSYYIVVRHRSSLATWSRTPVLFNSSHMIFDFTSP